MTQRKKSEKSRAPPWSTLYYPSCVDVNPRFHQGSPRAQIRSEVQYQSYFRTPKKPCETAFVAAGEGKYSVVLRIDATNFDTNRYAAFQLQFICCRACWVYPHRPRKIMPFSK